MIILFIINYDNLSSYRYPFKYDFMLHSPKDDFARGDCFYNNFTFEPCIRGDTQAETREQRGFFISREHYGSHSQQLVDALQEWIKDLSFSSCEYIDGRLQENIIENVEPEYTPYMNHMKRHLEKDDKNLLPNPLAIESKRREICLKIKNIMQPQQRQIPSRRSYEKIITDRIARFCPTKKKKKKDAVISSYQLTSIFM